MDENNKINNNNKLLKKKSNKLTVNYKGSFNNNNNIEDKTNDSTINNSTINNNPNNKFLQKLNFSINNSNNNIKENNKTTIVNSLNNINDDSNIENEIKKPKVQLLSTVDKKIKNILETFLLNILTQNKNEFSFNNKEKKIENIEIKKKLNLINNNMKKHDSQNFYLKHNLLNLSESSSSSNELNQNKNDNKNDNNTINTSFNSNSYRSTKRNNKLKYKLIKRKRLSTDDLLRSLRKKTYMKDDDDDDNFFSFHTKQFNTKIKEKKSLKNNSSKKIKFQKTIDNKKIKNFLDISSNSNSGNDENDIRNILNIDNKNLNKFNNIVGEISKNLGIRKKKSSNNLEEMIKQKNSINNKMSKNGTLNSRNNSFTIKKDENVNSLNSKKNEDENKLNDNNNNIKKKSTKKIIKNEDFNENNNENLNKKKTTIEEKKNNISDDDNDNNNEKIENEENFNSSINDTLNDEEKLEEERKQKFRILIKKNELVYDSLSDEELENFEDEISQSFFINPKSAFKIIYDFLLLLFLLFSMFYLPIILAFNSKLNNNISKKINFIEIINILIDIVFIIDIPLNFFTAFYNNIDERLITVNPNISYNYLGGYFLFDLISAIPFNSLFDLKIIDKFSNKILPDYYNGIYAFRIIRLLKSFKILTDNSFIKFLDKICNDYYNYTNFEKTFRLSLTLYICLFSFHLFGSIFIYIAYQDYPNWITESKIDPKSYFEIYICSIYFVCSTLFNIGYGDIHGYNLRERIFGLFLLIISVIIYSWIVSTLSKYYVEGDDKTQILKQKLYLLEDIKIQYNNMSFDLYEKIKRFLLYKKENDTKDFSLIYNDLPLMLRNNLIYEMYKPIINNFIFFKNFDNQDFIIKVILSLKPLFAVKGERLITERDFVDEIIFVKNGKLVLEFPLPIIVQNAPIRHSIFNILGGQKTGSKQFTLDNFDLKKTGMFGNASKLKSLGTRNSIINNNLNNNNNNNNNIPPQQYVKLIEIRKNEHFGDILMFLNKRCPLSVKVKSKKAELFLLMKTDAVEISMNFPKIWRKIIKNSLFNMQQLDRLINKTLKFFFIHFEGKDKNAFKTFIHQSTIGNSFSGNLSNTGILSGIYNSNNNEQSIEDYINEHDDELMSIPEESDDEMENGGLDQIKEESDENDYDSSSENKTSNKEHTESSNTDKTFSSSLVKSSSVENTEEEKEKTNESENNDDDKSDEKKNNVNNENNNANFNSNDNNSNLYSICINSKRMSCKIKEPKNKSNSGFKVLTKNKQRKSISFLVKNLNEIEGEKKNNNFDNNNNSSNNNNNKNFVSKKDNIITFNFKPDDINEEYYPGLEEKLKKNLFYKREEDLNSNKEINKIDLLENLNKNNMIFNSNNNDNSNNNNSINKHYYFDNHLNTNNDIALLSLDNIKYNIFQNLSINNNEFLIESKNNENKENKENKENNNENNENSSSSSVSSPSSSSISSSSLSSDINNNNSNLNSNINSNVNNNINSNVNLNVNSNVNFNSNFNKSSSFITNNNKDFNNKDNFTKIKTSQSKNPVLNKKSSFMKIPTFNKKISFKLGDNNNNNNNNNNSNVKKNKKRFSMLTPAINSINLNHENFMSKNSFIKKKGKNKNSTLAQIQNNIQNNEQNLKNPEVFYSEMFTNVISKVKEKEEENIEKYALKKKMNSLVKLINLKDKTAKI